MYVKQLFRKLCLFNNPQQTRYFTHSPFSGKISLYLHRARLIDSIRLILRSNGPRSLIPLLNDPTVDSFVVANALQSAPSPDSALSLLEILKTIPHFCHTQATIRALAKILAKSQRSAELKSLVDDINAGKFWNVRISFMELMKWHAAAGDLESVLHAWNRYRVSGKQVSIEAYNIVMCLYVQMGKGSEAMQIFHKIISEGAIPNSRTYTVVLEHLANSGKLDSAIKVFNILPLMRIRRTLRQYSILVEEFTSINRFDVVKALLDEMQIDGILPGRAMQLSLQRMQEAGFVHETDEFLRGMLPDERIKNVGFSVDSSDDDDDENNHSSDDAGVDGVQLKPWLDPRALANALNNWDPNEVLALEEAKFIWTTRLVCKILRNFNSPETAWKFFCWVAYQPGGFNHNIYTVQRMMTLLARHGHVELVEKLLLKIRREEIRLPVSTIRLIIDFYGISRNADAALKVFHDAESLCGPMSKLYLMLLYSSLLRTLTKCGRSADALDVLEQMFLGGICPDVPTFSGLMYHFALEGDFKTVQKLFMMVRQSGVEPDAYMFKVLIHGYCKCERSALALRVFEDMRSLNLMPDAATKNLLVKSLWKEGRRREAASVEERCEEINYGLPFALRGHMWTMSSADLKRVYDIYSNSFAAAKGPNLQMELGSKH
ncbi:pentatricopeptide repeat-containing protein At5g66631 [Vitis riparia]|uniref:pentatricopeptide repeat-containing protein At5g66631 n=1 Tax=Vitis riparia TaxID=96939 RepID=UPI00155AF74F|nr:pentatricopeptide repeat-containing protein At5g66631 [Vitis riparia]XP_034683039.1 pentatricopeptide repeat-containing protein At5g66631 [Vitis riparia]XP_034683040.1 pentatricopeptide repeat-containing protein At5g66631 [Vitis riparia]